MGRIHDLPIELFSLVLKYVVHHDIGAPGNYQWYGDPVVLDVLSIAQVCKKWRQFALNTPSLWTTLNDVLHPFVIEYALEHSSNLPLKVCLDFRGYFLQSDDDSDDNRGDEMQWQAIRNLASQIPRTSHLIVRFYPGHAHSLIPLLSHEAPLLEHFEIDKEHYDAFDLPPTIFNGNCPSLRHLVLCFSHILYDSPVLHNLTTLMLIWSTLEPPSRLVHMLSKLESLETLRLTGNFEMEDSVQIGAVVLPKLRHLSLIDIFDFDLYMLLLNHVKCPYASLRIIIKMRTTEDLVDLFLACNHWLSSHDGPGVIDNLKIDAGHILEDIQLEGFSSTEPAFRFSITISDQVEGSDSDNEDDAIDHEQIIITAGLSNLPLDSVHTLHFYIRSLASQQFWATVLSMTLPNLQTIEVCPLSARYWFDIFAWCMTCDMRAIPNPLRGVQEVVVRCLPDEWHTIAENMAIVHDARQAVGRPISFIYEEPGSGLPDRLNGILLHRDMIN